jgi:hypothetical protein
LGGIAFLSEPYTKASLWNASFFFNAAGLNGCLKSFPSFDLFLLFGVTGFSANFFLAANNWLFSLYSENNKPGTPLTPCLGGLV